MCGRWRSRAESSSAHSSGWSLLDSRMSRTELPLERGSSASAPSPSHWDDASSSDPTTWRELVTQLRGVTKELAQPLECCRTSPGHHEAVHRHHEAVDMLVGIDDNQRRANARDKAGLGISMCRIHNWWRVPIVMPPERLWGR